MFKQLNLKSVNLTKKDVQALFVMYLVYHKNQLINGYRDSKSRKMTFQLEMLSVGGVILGML